MDPIKIIIFVGAFLLLLILGRKLSGSGLGSDPSGMSPQGYPPEPVPSTVASPVDSNEEASGRKPVLVGADLPFPISLPEIEQDADGKYNRPEFLNYYFAKTDIKTGPANPETFYDEFFLQVRDVENHHAFTYRYTVATPAGLQQQMNSERLPSLYLGSQVVIVPRWDVRLILETVVEQILEGYTEPDDQDAADALPDEDTS